ncbi:MAG: heme biosynthesis HemY N-terminal domain-containing protein [Acidocella sp.]|nr:heme biosynthesis HemY N-terminal domain-containing protein [Acidocella sp.]
MLRAAKFLILAAVLLALAWWVGSLPGNVTAHAGPYTIATSTPAALLLIFLITLLFTILLRVLGGIRHAPGSFSAWRGGRRAKLGDIATQRGLVALAAGDATAARAEAGRAKKLLGETPLVLLLTAEAARLAGQTDEAAAAFQRLTQQKEMRYLGHRGLLRASLAAHDSTVAQKHALAAEEAYPGATWTRARRLELALREKDYTAALALTHEPAEVAALATAASYTTPNPHRALDYAKQAMKADPTLAPAIVALADALNGRQKPRAARKALLAGWKTTPHPLIAAAWFAPEATPLERAQDAAILAAANPGHAESELLLAQTALAANLPGEAKRHAEAALAAGATDGRAQSILDQLAGKPAIPSRLVWVCDSCHHAQAEWAAICPGCTAAGTMRWKAPGTALV